MAVEHRIYKIPTLNQTKGMNVTSSSHTFIYKGNKCGFCQNKQSAGVDSFTANIIDTH